jgi:Family of unknown function (DUF6492)
MEIVDPSFETVIVTYQHDFEKLLLCLESIVDHGLGHGNETVHIIVNDYVPAWYHVKEFVPDDTRFCVRPYYQLGPWNGPLGWYSQQWFKLCASKIVTADWYLILDSDDLLTRPITHADLFSNSRAYYRKTPIDFKNTSLVTRLSSAYWHWNDALGNRKYFMTDLTPFVMHTNTVKQMLLKINENLFDAPKDKLTTEFFLWSAYLDCYDLKDQLYEPVNSFKNCFVNAP